MGGAAGHILHLHEDWNLTISDVKSLLLKCMDGSIELYEKFDGINIAYTWVAGGVRIARSKNDMNVGGMDRDGIMHRFKDKQHVASAIINAIDLLEKILKRIPREHRSTMFVNGTLWHSAEVVSSLARNTIFYDEDAVILHMHPTLYNDLAGISQHRQEAHAEVASELLYSHIEKIQKNLIVKSNVLIPRKIAVNVGDSSMYENFVMRLDAEVLQKYDLTEDNTISDYLNKRARELVLSSGIPEKMCQDVANRLTREPGFKSLTILKSASKKHAEAIRSIVKDEDNLMKKLVSPLEFAINDFAIELLRGCKSLLINDADVEVARLKEVLRSSIESIASTTHDIAALERNLSKLGNVNNVSAIEGVVFKQNKKLYKLTGAFAPMHQIVSMVSYGR